MSTEPNIADGPAKLVGLLTTPERAASGAPEVGEQARYRQYGNAVVVSVVAAVAESSGLLRARTRDTDAEAPREVLP